MERRFGNIQSPASCHALRDALRGRADAKTVSRAAEPLIARQNEPLLRYCDALAKSARNRLPSLTGEDLLQEAWRKMLIYLTGDGGDRIKDDHHFERLMRVAARTQMLDWISQAGKTQTVSLNQPYGDDESSAVQDRVADVSPLPEELVIPRESAYLLLVQLLFTKPDVFHRRFRQANQRHPRQYQALVLYQMAISYRDACRSEPPDATRAELIAEFVCGLGVREFGWQQIVDSVNSEEATDSVDALYPGIMDAVNDVCGTKILQRKTLITYRAEMNRFAKQAIASEEFEMESNRVGGRG